jgi:hypothetical protein
MAARYWVGGAGTWDNSSTTHWSTTPSGSSGASAPTASDDVYFNEVTSAYTVTVNDTINVLSITLATADLNLNGNYVTAGTFTTAAGTKSLIFAGGTLSLTSSGTPFNNAANTGFTITSGGASGTISLYGSSAKTFAGGGNTYPCTLNQAGAGTLSITGANTFNDITSTYSATAATTITFPASVITTVYAFSGKGQVGKLLTLNSSVAGTSATIALTGATRATGLAYLLLTDLSFTPTPSVSVPFAWYGDSTCGIGSYNQLPAVGVTGIVFTGTGEGKVYVISSGSGTWTTPVDWNAASNNIHLIGGGGGGGGANINLAATNYVGTGGGGAGAGYTRVVNVSLSGGISYSVGAAGTGGVGGYQNGLVNSYKSIFAFGRNPNNTGKSNLVSTTGVIASDTAAVGSARRGVSGTPYGTSGKAMFAFGGTNTSSYSKIQNDVSTSGIIASDVTSTALAEASLRAAAALHNTGAGSSRSCFFFGGTVSGTSYYNNVEWFNDTATSSFSSTLVGTPRNGAAAVTFNWNAALIAYGQSGTSTAVNISNTISGTGSPSADITGVGTSRSQLGAAPYGADLGIFAFGVSGNTSTVYSLYNLMSNVGVLSTDTTGVGTPRAWIAGAPFGGDKAIFAFGQNSSSTYYGLSNLVSNTGVMATDTASVGTARSQIGATGYGAAPTAGANGTAGSATTFSAYSSAGGGAGLAGTSANSGNTAAGGVGSTYTGGAGGQVYYVASSATGYETAYGGGGAAGLLGNGVAGGLYGGGNGGGIGQNNNSNYGAGANSTTGGAGYAGGGGGYSTASGAAGGAGGAGGHGIELYGIYGSGGGGGGARGGLYSSGIGGGYGGGGGGGAVGDGYPATGANGSGGLILIYYDPITATYGGNFIAFF